MRARHIHPLALLFLGACAASDEGTMPIVADEPAIQEPHDQGDAHGHVLALLSAADVTAAAVNGTIELTQDVPFRQIGFMYDREPAGALQVSTRDQDGIWSEPQPVTLTWREGMAHVGHVLPPHEATAIRIVDADGVRFLRTQFYEEVLVPEHLRAATAALPQAPVTPTPVASPRTPTAREGDFATVGQAATLPGFVVTRAAWGATDPGRICGDVHDPYWLTIHHTVSPTPDSMTVAQRLRAIQAYHVNTNGWCDVGYHFLVGSDGRVYQGRSSEERVGAHASGANTNNVGISYIGTFSTIAAPANMIEAGGDIVKWLSDTFAIPLNRDRVRGHREWGSTECPGNALYPRLGDIIAAASGGGTVDPEPEPAAWAVELDARAVGLSDLLTQGSSAGVPDVVEGQTFQAEVLLTNNSPSPIRGVELGFAFDSPYLGATNWTISTDHPSYDRATWTLNSADSEPANPARDGLDSAGRLIMHAFSPRETKRVLLSLAAGPASIGRIDQPDVRTWLRTITDVYGPQNTFETAPALNLIGRNVNDFNEFDVLSKDAWLFDAADDPDNVEGWTNADPTNLATLGLNGEGMLAARAVGPNPTIDSPGWTRIDADRFTELVLQHRAYEGVHTLQLWWAADGQTLDSTRTLTFQMPGDGTLHTARIALDEHPEWRGEIRSLRLALATDARIGADLNTWYDVDALYFQAAGDGSTSDPRVTFYDGPFTDVQGGGSTGEDAGSGDAGIPDAGDADAGGSSDTTSDATPDSAGESDAANPDPVPDRDPAPRPDDDRENDSTQVKRSSSCSTVNTPGAALPLTALALLALRRRRDFRLTTDA